MTVPVAFFREPSAMRLMARAAAVAATPLSLHYGEDMHVLGWGACAACHYINAHQQGAGPCRGSRAKAAALAFSQDVPVTFVCHLGFTCVLAPALPDNAYTITFGPYIPAESAEAFEDDVRRGLMLLEGDYEDAPLPFSLKDIRFVPAGAVSAAAEWLCEGLRSALVSYEVEVDPAEEALDAFVGTGPGGAKRGARNDHKSRLPRDTRTALPALALVCGLIRHTKASLAEVLDDCAADPHVTVETLQLRTVRYVSEVLESTRRMGGPTEAAWARYAAFTEEARTLRDQHDLVRAAMRVLRKANTSPELRKEIMPAYLPEVMRQLYSDYKKNGLRLDEIAPELGAAPSSITRALEIRTGATFSGCLSRIRIEQACRLLRSSRLSASRIAARIGINDQSNFTKLFQRYMGMTPGAYRARVMKSK